MDCTINETLEYILFLTRHIRKGNIRAATLAILMDMGFSEHSEGFGYLRSAILIRVGDAYLRFGAIYRRIAEMYGSGTSDKQVEQDIRALITEAWKYRNADKWLIVFPPNGNRKQERPSNGKVIARFACLLELWRDCCEEVSYAG